MSLNPDSGTGIGRRIRCTDHKAMLLLLIGLLASLKAGTAISAEADKNIFVSVQNSHPMDRFVTVVDDICESIVFQGRVIKHGKQQIEICAQKFRGGTVTIVNQRSGAEHQYRNVLNGTNLRVP